MEKQRERKYIQTDTRRLIEKRGGGRLEREENFRNREIKRKKESETDRVTQKKERERERVRKKHTDSQTDIQTDRQT